MQAVLESAVADIELDEDAEMFIARQVAEGRFASASDVVRAGLALLERQQRDRSARYERLVAEIRDALNDPTPPVPAEQVFDRLERELQDEIRREAEGRIGAEGS